MPESYFSIGRRFPLASEPLCKALEYILPKDAIGSSHLDLWKKAQRDSYRRFKNP